jgi:hypothetical protein
MLASCTNTKVTPTSTNPSIKAMPATSPEVNHSPAAEVPVTATPVNRSPVLETIGNRTVSQSSLLEFTVRATDPDGDNLNFTASTLPPAATFNNSTQIFSFIPESVGTFPNVSFSVTDGQATVSQNISITVSPVLPVLLMKPAEGVVPLALIYYGDATTTASSTILSVRPQYLISNPSHGLWGEISEHDSTVFQDLSSLR